MTANLTVLVQPTDLVKTSRPEQNAGKQWMNLPWMHQAQGCITELNILGWNSTIKGWKKGIPGAEMKEYVPWNIPPAS